MSSTNDIYAALFALVWGAAAWKNDQSTARRLKLWNEVPLEGRPALYQFEGGNRDFKWTNSAKAARTLRAQLILYTNAKSGVGIVQVNDLIDAVEASLQPKVGQDQLTGRLSLGGLVQWCRIEGEVFADPGDLDGDGFVRIPIVMLVP